ncbi:MAG: 4-hydroxy-tetrahydrodipicolinate synthase [Evtepia sp.]
MKDPIFKGTCTAITTPFSSTGAVDYDLFSRLIERQIESGIDALCVCGTTGESATLCVREHISVVEHCIRQVAGRCKVIAGSGSNDTQAALYLSQHAQDSGADALLLVTPYYNKTTQTGLIRHYEYIAEHTELPILLYNVPSRTGISLTAATYETLSKHPRINGTKEASGNFSLILDTVARCGDDLNLWSGNDDHVIAMMSLGACGVISVAANLIPEPMIRMTHLFLNGKIEESATLQKRYAALIHALFIEVNPIPIKTALQAIGLDSGHFRLPLCEMSTDNRLLLWHEMQALGLHH